MLCSVLFGDLVVCDLMLPWCVSLWHCICAILNCEVAVCGWFDLGLGVFAGFGLLVEFGLNSC